jgi:hypothetical protein
MTHYKNTLRWSVVIALLYCLSLPGIAISGDTPEATEGENASNPLAAVNNTDLRLQLFDLDGSGRQDYFIDGAKMLSPKMKLKYEVHYWQTDVTGQSENNLESLHLRFIYFPVEGKLGTRPYRLAVGAEWIKDLGDTDKGIGSGADQIAPLVGVALKFGDTMVIPLLQHFESYSGADVRQTASRLIAIKPLPSQAWLKLDAKIPYDWESYKIPASAELQLGKTFFPMFGAYSTSHK